MLMLTINGFVIFAAVIFALLDIAMLFALEETGAKIVGFIILLLPVLILGLLAKVIARHIPAKESATTDNLKAEAANEEIFAPIPEEHSEPVTEPATNFVGGKYLMRYVDSKGEFSEREISKVILIDYNHFKAFCHVRKRTRTFKFESVQEIVDLSTGKATRNALQLFLNHIK